MKGCLLPMIGLLMLAVLPVAHADTLRCGNQLVSTGDRAFEVERKCGPPVQRDLIGYGIGPNQRQESLIEEWVYGPQNGAFNILTFEANRLVRIEMRRDR
ncbi:DUF2845 domain-containing protein [Stutzerimonas azotifigens]|uniref:DUF2845 domain-containing protein n=1 Tax=Stutzerimonas azotifigens TaxID=291995 RepID=UPI0009FC1EFD|nr:DUF2845 domain-containing protein [Stutzerimonas azotifigens]